MTRSPTLRAAAFAVLAFALPAVARAQAQDDTSQTGDAAERTSRAAGKGNFLTLSHPAGLDGHRAIASAVVGYDGARGTSLFEASTEVQLWGPLSVRAGAVYTNAGSPSRSAGLGSSGTQTLRPSAGLRYQAFSEARHGVDGSVGVFYRPEGLTQPEGEIELVTAVGGHAGRTYLLGNLLYGQDPEARERDGEVRLSALYPVLPRLLVGADSRLRFDLGSDPAKRNAKGEPTLDVLAGPVATLLIDRVAVFSQGGFAAVRRGGITSTGAFVQAGLATSF